MKTFISYINNILIPILPETRCFALKRWMWKRAGVRIGRNVRISSSAKMFGAGELSIGDNTWIGHQCTIIASSRITIGANVDIAPKVYIGTGTHTINPNSEHIAATDISRDVTIGDGCWLCVNSTILPGTELAAKTVVGAGAIVSSVFKEDCILIAGIPAKKIKSYV